jgi:trk system potassium uptake protein TrkA
MKVIIVGGGQVGAYLASLLLGRGYTVKVIEERESRMPVLKRDLPESAILFGSGTDPHLLEQAGIKDADVVAAVTGADETNLVVATLARLEYGVPRVVGRVNNPKNAWLFTPVMGVDVALNQADLMGRLVAEEMFNGDMMTLLNLHRGEFSLVEKRIAPSSPLAGKPMREAKLPEGCLLVAVTRGAELIIPKGYTVLEEGDIVVALTPVVRQQALSELLGEN